MRALWPFIKLFKYQWGMMLAGLALSVATLMAGIGLLSLSGWFLSAAAVAGLTLAAKQAFNYFTPGSGVRLLSIGRTLSRYGERLATHEATFRLLTRLRVWVWRKVLPLSARNMQGFRQGELLNRLVADIDTLDHLYLRLVTPVFSAFFALLLLFIFVIWFDATLALMLCVSLLSVWLVLPWVFYLLGRKPGIELMESKRLLRIRILEYVQGLADISLFGADDRFRRQLARSEAALLHSQRAMATVTALGQAAVTFCHGLVMVGMLYVAASGVGIHQPPGPMFAMVAFMALACMEMLLPIAGAFQHLSSCVSAAVRVNELVDQSPAITYPGRSEARLKQGAVQLQNIRFSYHRRDRQVLKGINMSIQPGEKVAVLGKTGCGKSSLLSLITREWEPDAGSVLLDGVDIKTYSRKAFTNGLSIMSQRIYLFSGTLRDNLAMAQTDIPESGANDRFLIEVLEKVGLSVLTQGKKPLDAWIGEGGRQLSGGEQRRIGVARVLLRNAPLLLLDEPTEGLDKRTEREILSLLFEFIKDKTLLLISHRLTAMEKMDQIYLMEDGVFRVSGHHNDLLTTDSYYADLHQQLH